MSYRFALGNFFRKKVNYTSNGYCIPRYNNIKNQLSNGYIRTLMSSNEGKCLIMIILTPKTIDFKRAGINML